jgi:hypothetical protein
MYYVGQKPKILFTSGVANNNPVNVIAPVISGTAERGSTLSCTTGTWTFTGSISYAYQWKRNGVNISGANANTYLLVAADDNAFITCLVTATDNNGSTSKISNTLGPVLGALVLVSNPVISGTATVGETLTSTTGVFTGKPVISYAFQWRRNGSNIVGATTNTYVLVSADYNTNIDCVVTATNSIGSLNDTSNTLGPIQGIAPVITGVPTFTGTEQVGQTLTATAAVATGTPTPTISWQWQRSNGPGPGGFFNILGATSISYLLDIADDTKYIRVVQTATNALGVDTANSSVSGQITNVPAFDADYQAVLDYGTLQGYTLPSGGQQTLQNDLLVALKAAGVWSKLDTFANFATDGDSDFALIDWKRVTDYTAINSPTFTTNQGYEGNATSSYIDTNYNPNTSGVNFSLNNASVYLYVKKEATLGTFRVILSYSGNLGMCNEVNTRQRLNNGSSNLTTAVDLGGIGMKSINRTSATNLDLYSNTTLSSRTQSSTSIYNGNNILLGTLSLFSNAQISCHASGASLSTENTDFVNAYNTYMTSI